MKRIVFYAAMAIALVTPFICAARTLSVSAPDGDGNVTITIGGEGIGDQQLIAAWANGDNGTNPTNWAEYADAGAVAAADTSKSYQLPAAWRAKSGMVRFFLMSGMPPYKTRYDYITRPNCANGGLYIDTGIVPDKTIDITVKSQSESVADMAAFGNQDVFIFANGNDYSFSQNCYVFAFLGVAHHGAGSYSASNVLLNSDTNVFGDKPPKSIAPHTFRMCRDGIYIDGYRHLGPFDDSELIITSTSSLYLFGRNAGNQKQSGKTCSIYSATIVTNGIPAHEYVPCEKSDGTVTMYDRVTQSFSVAAGTQASSLLFQPGNDMGPWPTDCGDVDGVSGVVGIGPAIRIVDVDSNTHSISVSLSSGHDAGLLFAVAGASDVGETYSSWTTNMLVSKVGVGTNSVTVALPRDWWRGKYVRFAWRSLVGRPYDYDVSYIHADHTGGDNFCRTGWKPTTNTTIHVNAKTALDVAPFGVAGYFVLFLNAISNSKFFYVYGDKYNATGVDCSNWSTFANYYHDWRLGPTEARVDDLVIGTYSGAAPDASVTANICLPFRASSKTDHNTVTKAGNAEVKFAKIWEGDVLVRDFAPCVYTNGVPGFYDNVRGEFYPSVNAAKPFVAGDIVIADSDFVSWSPARKLTKGFVITFR